VRWPATLLCAAAVAFLFWRELRNPAVARISWAPFWWMAIAGTRFVSAWLQLGSAGSVESYSEGSPLDRAVFFSLIVWGTVVLYRRKLDWRQILTRHVWIVLYFLYCLASVGWADEPLTLVRRLVKDLGNPIMVLVLLTERQQYDALALTFRRLAYFFLPVSLLFIRYFPEYGRSYSNWGGVGYSGAADQKNTLGLSCLIIGICYVWSYLYKRKLLDRYDLALGAILAWLVYMADSKTAVTCFVVGLALLFCTRLTVISRRPTRIITVTAVSAALYLLANQFFNAEDYLLSLLGRSPTLTNRTEVWAVLRNFQANAFVGAGFMSFWTGARMGAIWEAIGGRINQAHNGYLEQYLNLGYVGVAFIIVIAIAALFSIGKELRDDYPVGVLRLCFLVLAMLYNYTEASFYGINNMWILFLAASIGTAGLRSAENVRSTAPPVRSATRGPQWRQWRALPARHGTPTEGIGATASRQPNRVRPRRRSERSYPSGLSRCSSLHR
jgi:hypothetical protein